MFAFSGIFARREVVQRGQLRKDRTGLPGMYDFTLLYQPKSMPSAAADSSTADAWPGIFTALQEQLELKLEPGKAPKLLIVVD